MWKELLSDKEPDLAYRVELEKLTTPMLYAKLVSLVPDVQVERNNRNRVMRMLERIHDGDDAVPAKKARSSVSPIPFPTVIPLPAAAALK